MNLLESMLGRVGVVDDEGPCKFRSDRYDVTFTVSTDSHDVAYAIPASSTEVDAVARLVRVERETPYTDGGTESLTDALETVLDDESIDVEVWVERMAAPRRTVEPIVETWQRLATASGTDVDGPENGAGGDRDDGGVDGRRVDDRERNGDATDDEERNGDTTDDEEHNGGATRSTGEGESESVDRDEPADEGTHDEPADEGTHDERAMEGDGDEFDVRVVYLPVGMESAIPSFFDLCRRRNERASDPFEFPDDVAPAVALLSRIDDGVDRDDARVVVNTRHLPPT